MTRPIHSSLISHNGRMRPGWRLVVFFFLFFLLSAAGNLAVSVLPHSPLQWGNLVAALIAALLASWIVLSRLDQRPAAVLGFPLGRTALPESVAGTALGAVLIAFAVVLLLVSRSATFVRDAGSSLDYLAFLGWTFVFFAVAAAFEEVLFRGYPFQVLVEWIGVWPAVLIASTLFAFLHGQNPNITPLAIVNIFGAGVLLSIAYLRTLSLWFATGVHLGWNWMLAGPLDFPVSGLEFDTPLYDGVPTGPLLWTGGAFGPEAGMAVTIALLVGGLWLWKSARIRPDPHSVALRPIGVERVRASGLI